MTPRRAGEILGYLTGTAIVLVVVWLVLVAIAWVVAKVLRRPFVASRVMRSPWILGVVGLLFILQLFAALGTP